MIETEFLKSGNVNNTKHYINFDNSGDIEYDTHDKKRLKKRNETEDN